MNQPRILSAVVALALLTSLGAAAPALAQPAPGPASRPGTGYSECFSATEFSNWRAIDDKAIYIRVNLNDYYRIEMSGECPELTYPDPHLVTVWRGSNEVCGPLDWDLKVADGSGPGSFATPCIVKSQTRLTPAEVAAIPKNLKP